MKIILEKEQKTTKHSFFCKLKEGTKKVEIMNAADSPYKKGWIDYAPFESVDGKTWKRLKPGYYDGKTFSFSVSRNAKYACWFPNYDIEKMQKFCTLFQELGKNAFFLGNEEKPTIVLMAGQHPAETMGLYFLEGILRTVSSDKAFLDNFSLLVFPYVNKRGMQNGNHRLTPSGIDLNRDWANPNNPLLNSIKEQISRFTNIYAIIDIHGDEVSQKDYVIYNRYFRNTPLAECCAKQGFLLLKKQSTFKKFLKALIRQRKIVLPSGQTARDCFEKQHIPSITIELSAKSNTPESCIQKGMNFLQEKTNRKYFSTKIKKTHFCK